MFKEIQKEVNELHDFIISHKGKHEDNVYIHLTNLLAEAGEAADEVKGLEGARAESPEDYSKDELAKELVDVIFNTLRLAKYYDINLDDHFMKRMDGIRRKFDNYKKR